jgi:alcohol dehydrogenase
MLQLSKFVTPEIIFGVGARNQVGNIVSKFGAKHILVVSDPGVIACGWTQQVIDKLEESKITWTLFSKVTPNPRSSEVMEGADIFLSRGCDAMVAVGGGSVIDCAKAIGIVVSNGGDILRFEGADQVERPMPPVICIPTTGGTGADVSQFSIITDILEHRKFAIVSKAIVPDVSLVDPETLTTMDNYLTACTGIDTLVHAIEAFVSKGSSPLTDLYALNAVSLVTKHLAASIQEPQNLNFRKEIMLASLEAGIAFSNASLGAAHAMAHSLGGVLDLAHGECNAIVLSNVIEFNFDDAPERFRKIAEFMGLDLRGMINSEAKKTLTKAVSHLRKGLGVNKSLGEAGVKSTDIPLLAKRALQDICVVTNPRIPNHRDIEVLYEESI